MQFKDQIVWITGASSGIGRALAVAMAREGAQLIVSGRNEAALAEVVAECPGATALPFEVTDLDTLPAIVAKAEALHGRIDMLVNNAGIAQHAWVKDSDFQLYRTLMEVDYFAPVRLTQLVLPAMRARGSGHLVAVGSLSGRFGNPTASGYCGAKFALVGWFEALRSEVAHEGLKVTIITPGFVKTAIAGRALGPNGQPVAPGRMGERGIEADEAAEIILKGFADGRYEIPVGRGPEMGLLDLNRSDPDKTIALMASLGEQMAKG